MKTKLITGLLLVVVVMTGVSLPQVAEAQYQPRTQQEQIAYLFGVISQLQMQLAQLQANQYRSQSTYPLGQVLGISTSNTSGSRSNRDLEAETHSADDVDEDSAVLRGSFDPGRYDAEIWFEYGRSTGLTSRTSRVDIRSDRSYERRLTNLREDERYYFRAVIRDEYGNTDYGSIRSFTTDDDNRRSSRSYGDDVSVRTGDAERIEADTAVLTGEVDTEDVDRVTIFFLYGQDEDEVEDAAREDRHRDIYQSGQDLQKIVVESSFYGDEEFERRIYWLEEGERYYFSLCVEYIDDDDDRQLECGSIEDFETED